MAPTPVPLLGGTQRGVGPPPSATPAPVLAAGLPVGAATPIVAVPDVVVNDVAERVLRLMERRTRAQRERLGVV
jgi:hypothetical protein